MDLRLVVQFQAAGADGKSQALGNLHALGQSGTHVFRVGDMAATRRLGTVHGDIGVLEQILDADAVLGIQGDADAGAKRKRVADAPRPAAVSACSMRRPTSWAVASSADSAKTTNSSPASRASISVGRKRRLKAPRHFGQHLVADVMAVACR